jgi:hypothetical protein
MWPYITLKHLVKNLITTTQPMEPLPSAFVYSSFQIILRRSPPGRRFATFKLFYQDNTPDDYEPPCFVAGHPVKDRLVFGTHGMNEVPEKARIGVMDTSYHAYVTHKLLASEALTLTLRKREH